MDHAHYRYSAMPFRNEGLLPPGLNLFVVLYLEHWDFQSPEGSLRDPRFVGEFGSFNPDYRSWTQREYGLRIGVFRIIEALQRHGITPAVAANRLVLPRVPTAIEALRQLGSQWLGHGLAATRIMHSRMPEQEQREHIESSSSALQEQLGHKPLGWVSQDWGTSVDTWRLLAQAGFRYTLDWGNDDQAYWMQPWSEGQPRLLALPLSSEWDDVQAQWMRHLEPKDHAQAILHAAQRLAAESQAKGQGVTMGLGLHPWVWGMPSRITHLHQLLGALNGIDGANFTTPDTLYQHCAQAHTA